MAARLLDTILFFVISPAVGQLVQTWGQSSARNVRAVVPRPWLRSRAHVHTRNSHPTDWRRPFNSLGVTFVVDGEAARTAPQSGKRLIKKTPVPPSIPPPPGDSDVAIVQTLPRTLYTASNFATKTTREHRYCRIALDSSDFPFISR